LFSTVLLGIRLDGSAMPMVTAPPVPEVLLTLGLALPQAVRARATTTGRVIQAASL
jgi:hypothetical protein